MRAVKFFSAKSCVVVIPFTEKVKISFEIIYVSQVKHIFNISRAFKKIHKLENRIKILEDELSQMKANMKEKK